MIIFFTFWHAHWTPCGRLFVIRLMFEMQTEITYSIYIDPFYWVPLSSIDIHWCAPILICLKWQPIHFGFDVFCHRAKEKRKQNCVAKDVLWPFTNCRWFRFELRAHFVCCVWHVCAIYFLIKLCLSQNIAKYRDAMRWFLVKDFSLALR